VIISNATFSYTLPALSIVSFSGMATNITISTPSLAPGKVSMLVSGQPGLNYTLLRSTDLRHWEPVMVSNPAAFHFTMSDTNFFFDGSAYYRVVASP